MRDQTASRNYSPEADEFLRRHEGHRAWGLACRHAEKARRLRAADRSRPGVAPTGRIDPPPPRQASDKQAVPAAVGSDPAVPAAVAPDPAVPAAVDSDLAVPAAVGSDLAVPAAVAPDPAVPAAVTPDLGVVAAVTPCSAEPAQVRLGLDRMSSLSREGERFELERSRGLSCERRQRPQPGG